MEVVEVELWAKVYAVEVEVEAEWMDDVFTENTALSTRQHSAVGPVLFPHHRLKEVQSMGYILVLILHDF